MIHDSKPSVIQDQISGLLKSPIPTLIFNSAWFWYPWFRFHLKLELIRNWFRFRGHNRAPLLAGINLQCVLFYPFICACMSKPAVYVHWMVKVGISIHYRAALGFLRVICEQWTLLDLCRSCLQFLLVPCVLSTLHKSGCPAGPRVPYKRAKCNMSCCALKMMGVTTSGTLQYFMPCCSCFSRFTVQWPLENIIGCNDPVERGWAF